MGWGLGGVRMSDLLHATISQQKVSSLCLCLYLCLCLCDSVTLLSHCPVVSLPVTMAITFEQGDSLHRLEILELNDDIWPAVEDRLNELVQHRIIGVACEALLACA